MIGIPVPRSVLFLQLFIVRSNERPNVSGMSRNFSHFSLYKVTGKRPIQDGKTFELVADIASLAAPLVERSQTRPGSKGPGDCAINHSWDISASMTAFFASIRNYFKSKFHGRYFSLILREIAQHEPQTFSLMIDQVKATSPLPFWREVSTSMWNGDLT